MRETRLHARKRESIRRQIVGSIKRKNYATESTKMDSPPTHDLQGAYIPSGIFPLLSLPIELQRMIFEYAVAEPDKIIMLDNAKTPALARVNKHLRANVLAIYLSSNTFRVFTEEAPRSDTFQKDARFKIHHSVMEWLDPLGFDTPLFKSLIVHFGADNETELVFQHSRKNGGLQLSHELHCSYCKTLSPHYPTLPRTILASLGGQDQAFRDLINQAEDRNTAVKIEHDITVADLTREIFGEVGGLKRDSLALSMADIMGIERVLNESDTIFSIAVHTINMKRLSDTPLLVLHNGTQYVLRRDTSA